jgi:hypothetical protein
MNKNDIYGLLINPFTRIAGWQAFIIGAVFVLLTGIAGTYANVYFDGAIDMHFNENANLKTSFNYLGIDLLSLVFTLSLAGIFVSKSFRLLDILGTVCLAKAPFLLLAIAALAVDVPATEQIMRDPSSI